MQNSAATLQQLCSNMTWQSTERSQSSFVVAVNWSKWVQMIWKRSISLDNGQMIHNHQEIIQHQTRPASQSFSANQTVSNIKEFVWNCWNVEQSRVVTEKLLIPGAVRIMFLSGYSGHTVTLVLHMSGRQRLYNLLQLNIPAFTSCLQSVNNNYWWLTILLIKRQKDCSLKCICLQSIFELNMFHELLCLALCLQMQE